MSESKSKREVRPGPLGHVLVVDLTQHLAGPFASQILGDLGARVVKIEPPGGDSTRHIGPHFIDGDSAYYLSVNRNKESVCIDLKAPGGRDALLRLVREADVVIENYRPGTMEKLGIGYDVLSEVNPGVVMCSLSGFGPDGPYRDRPAFDMIVQALAGGMSLTGEPGGMPVRSGLPIGDLCAGMNAAIGVLAGLVRASAEGRGSRIDVAMLDTQVSLLSYVASYYLLGDQVAGLQGRGHMSIPTYRGLRCADGKDIVVAANTQRMWLGLCKAMGLPELADDERFTDNETRRAHRPELDALLEAAALRVASAELLERLSEAGVPSAPINAVDEALADPQIEHQEMILSMPRGDVTVKAVGNPIKVSEARSLHDAPPRLGEHTESVLTTLAGLDHDAVAALAAAGAVQLPNGAGHATEKPRPTSDPGPAAVADSPPAPTPPASASTSAG
jgi:CoA:oxalate CoA-transferase